MLKQKFLKFMYGRYGATAGVDGLCWFLFALSLILSFVARFFNGIAALVISLVSTAAGVYMLFRFLSKNIYARQKENRKFMALWNNKMKPFFKLQGDRFRDRKTHVYKRCGKCKSIIRLPRKKGRHSVVCPKCGNRFNVNNIF